MLLISLQGVSAKLQVKSYFPTCLCVCVFQWLNITGLKSSSRDIIYNQYYIVSVMCVHYMWEHVKSENLPTLASPVSCSLDLHLSVYFLEFPTRVLQTTQPAPCLQNTLTSCRRMETRLVEEWRGRKRKCNWGKRDCGTTVFLFMTPWTVWNWIKRCEMKLYLPCSRTTGKANQIKEQKRK